ncbi:MAG TPA: zinc ribbon domain-containing protein [Pyrinomonadaceae bacterium]
MNNPACPACGHANRVGAAACEACDARLYEPACVNASGPFGDEREPSDPASESSWTASEPGGSDARQPGEAVPAPPFKGAGDVIPPMPAVYQKHFTLAGLLGLLRERQTGFQANVYTPGPAAAAAR